MLPTPDVGHLRRPEYRDVVYDPAEDTFALIDALEADADALCAAHATLCVEIGSGSGCVSAFVSTLLGHGVACVCTDISEVALRCTAETGTRNGVRSPVKLSCADLQSVLSGVCCSTVDALRPRAEGAVDVLLFNPPYVVTPAEEEAELQAHAGLGSAWAGGPKGTALVDALLQQRVFPRMLSPGGRLYLVAIRQNDPEGIVQALVAQGLDAEVRPCMGLVTLTYRWFYGAARTASSCT